VIEIPATTTTVIPNGPVFFHDLDRRRSRMRDLSRGSSRFSDRHSFRSRGRSQGCDRFGPRDEARECHRSRERHDNRERNERIDGTTGTDEINPVKVKVDQLKCPSKCGPDPRPAPEERELPATCDLRALRRPQRLQPSTGPSRRAALYSRNK
jgi:hypothetical protein